MLYDKRLNQIKYVVDKSKHVEIDDKKIDEFIESINEIPEYKHWLADYKNNFTENEIILFVFLLESMNFCFWNEPIFMFADMKKSEAMFNIWLTKTIEDNRLLDIDYLKNITYKDLINIFGIEEANLKNRYTSLMSTINVIYSKKGFYDELYLINNVDLLFEYIVTNFINFNDVSKYKNREIYFYKRATLLVNDLFELSPTIRKNIKSIDSCLGCADYGIPKGLRSLQILKYDDKLSEIVDNEKPILKDSEYEVEIRANMLYVIEMLREKLSIKGIHINSVRLDNIIWLKSRGKEGKSHRTNTVFY